MPLGERTQAPRELDTGGLEPGHGEHLGPATDDQAPTLLFQAHGEAPRRAQRAMDVAYRARSLLLVADEAPRGRRSPGDAALEPALQAIGRTELVAAAADGGPPQRQLVARRLVEEDTAAERDEARTLPIRRPRALRSVNLERGRLVGFDRRLDVGLLAREVVRRTNDIDIRAPVAMTDAADVDHLESQVVLGARAIGGDLGLGAEPRKGLIGGVMAMEGRQMQRGPPRQIAPMPEGLGRQLTVERLAGRHEDRDDGRHPESRREVQECEAQPRVVAEHLGVARDELAELALVAEHHREAGLPKRPELGPRGLEQPDELRVGGRQKRPVDGPGRGLRRQLAGLRAHGQQRLDGGQVAPIESELERGRERQIEGVRVRAERPEQAGHGRRLESGGEMQERLATRTGLDGQPREEGRARELGPPFGERRAKHRRRRLVERHRAQERQRRRGGLLGLGEPARARGHPPEMQGVERRFLREPGLASHPPRGRGEVAARAGPDHGVGAWRGRERTEPARKRLSQPKARGEPERAQATAIALRERARHPPAESRDQPDEPTPERCVNDIHTTEGPRPGPGSELHQALRREVVASAQRAQQRGHAGAVARLEQPLELGLLERREEPLRERQRVPSLGPGRGQVQHTGEPRAAPHQPGGRVAERRFETREVPGHQRRDERVAAELFVEDRADLMGGLVRREKGLDERAWQRLVEVLAAPQEELERARGRLALEAPLRQDEQEPRDLGVHERRLEAHLPPELARDLGRHDREVGARTLDEPRQEPARTATRGSYRVREANLEVGRRKARGRLGDPEREPRAALLGARVDPGDDRARRRFEPVDQVMGQREADELVLARPRHDRHLEGRDLGAGGRRERRPHGEHERESSDGHRVAPQEASDSNHSRSGPGNISGTRRRALSRARSMWPCASASLTRSSSAAGSTGSIARARSTACSAAAIALAP
jgi:hypothetical protein